MKCRIAGSHSIRQMRDELNLNSTKEEKEEMITSRMVRLVSLLCVFVLCIGVGACAPAEQAAPSYEATIIMVPQSGPPKTTVQLYGSGFQPGEEINVEVVNAVMPIGVLNLHVGPEPAMVVADESGAWTSKDWSRGSTGIRPEITPGIYTLRATGNQGSVATTPYIVEEKKKK